METQTLVDRRQVDRSDFILDFSKGDSAKIDEQASLVTSYYDHYNQGNKEPPEDFDQSLIVDFLRVLSDPERPPGLRLRASQVLCKLMKSERYPLMHTILEKGALDVLEQCIRGIEYGLYDNCMHAVSEIAKHSTECNRSVRNTSVLETIANLIQSERVYSLKSHSLAVACFLAILLTSSASLQPDVALQMVSAIIKTLRCFGTDDTILKDSLNSLTALTFTGNFGQYEHVQPQIDAILKEDDIITMTFDVIATGSPTLVKSALSVFVNLSSGSDEQDKLLMTRDGFMQMLVESLHSSCGEVRRKGLLIIGNLTRSSHIELILKEIELIAKLRHLLDHDDVDLQKKVCEAFSRLFVSLATRPVTSMEDFVENGVSKIVESASKSGADSQVVNMIREVLPRQLLTHPEFCSIAEEVALTSENANTAILDWWRLMRGLGWLIKGIAGSLKSVANVFDCSSTMQTDTVPECDAVTVERSPAQSVNERKQTTIQ